MSPMPESTRDPLRSRVEQATIDETSLESFPASDAPSWTAMHAGMPMAQKTRLETPRDVRARLDRDLRLLATELGERNDGSSVARANLSRAADHISASLLDAGLAVTRIPVPGSAVRTENLEAVLRPASRARGDIVVGAHYDTVRGRSVGYDDASGVAVLLALAQLLRNRRFARAVRFVAFTNEEPPHTRKPTMGSHVYAERLARQGVRVEGMIAIDRVGLGGPLALVGNIASRHLVREATEAFRTGTKVPVRGVTLPGFLPLVSAGDHRSFWKHGFCAAMLTDGGPLRTRRHHAADAGAAGLSVDRMVDVVFGMASLVTRLAGGRQG